MTGWEFMRRRRVLLLIGLILGLVVRTVYAQALTPPTEPWWSIWLRDNALAIVVIAYHVGVNFQEFKRLKVDVKELQNVDKAIIADLEASSDQAETRFVHKDVMAETLRTINVRFDHMERLIVGRSRHASPEN